MTDDIRFRRPVDGDHPRIIGVIDEWWGGRKIHRTLPRLWFQHFAGTSWLAEDRDGRPIGLLVGFISQDHPDQAYVHLVGTSPNHRRIGLGRRLYEAFFRDVAARGIRRVSAVTWPADRASVAFHRALGFDLDRGPGSQDLYGSPAFPDYDADGEDRVVLSRDL